MCPACLTTAALLVAGATSAGGLTTLAVKKLRNRSQAKVVLTVSTGHRARAASNARSSKPREEE